jgi:hypothetical protein
MVYPTPATTEINFEYKTEPPPPPPEFWPTLYPPPPPPTTRTSTTPVVVGLNVSIPTALKV